MQENRFGHWVWLVWKGTAMTIKGWIFQEIDQHLIRESTCGDGIMNDINTNDYIGGGNYRAGIK